MRTLPSITTALVIAISGAPSEAAAGGLEVKVDGGPGGRRLLVNGAPYFVQGMNWGYTPIGENYSYNLWGQSDDFIESALRTEMSMLKAAGVNTIRMFAGVPPKWVRWIYVNYGITTMINPLVGRYGVTVNGRFVPVVDYSDPVHREAIRRETLASVEQYKNTEGVLFYLLGNENNYGLAWKSFEIEALPQGEREAAKARYLYSLMGELVDAIHAADPSHPVALANGDLQYIDLIDELMPNLDIMGGNVYRGPSARDLYARVEEVLGIPFVYTEFGSDAYNSRTQREDGAAQAALLHAQWQEIYLQSAGKGGVGNAIGGAVFQWADGWWKHLQEQRLDIHDTTASWPNAGYAFDYVEGQNNMNEEWFGVCALGPTGPDGQLQLEPRPAYYLLQQTFRLDPTDPAVDAQAIRQHFAAIDLPRLEAQAAAGQLAPAIDDLRRVRLTQLQLDMASILSATTTEDGVQAPIFDHMENLWVGAEATPVNGVRADARMSMLGNTPENRIDKLFWEAAGQQRFVRDVDGQPLNLGPLQRTRIHDAGFEVDRPLVKVQGYYRQGHFHWGYEGDFFGFYREANYGPNPDIYQAQVPVGIEVTGKGALSPLKVAMGPQIYWGANPTAIAKFRQQVGPVTLSVLHQEDLARSGTATTSSAISEPRLRRSAVVLETGAQGEGLTLGGIWAGSNKVGQTFAIAQPAAGADSYGGSGQDVLEDQVRMADTLGLRAKIAHSFGPVSAYLQGGHQGLVADAGPDPVPTFTGWRLKQSGRGNHQAVLGGMAVNLGSFQIAPSALWQRPLVGPLPVITAGVDATTGRYTPGVTPRNFVDDPFVVRENRETKAVELLLVYDPTPGSWMWMWDNFAREDARFSAAIDGVIRWMPTGQDSHVGFTQDGQLFSFDAAAPAATLFDLSGHVHLRPTAELRMRLSGYGGTKQSTGSDTRTVSAWGGTFTGWYRNLSLDSTLRVNDWGPYDYHRDFNLTFPLQVITDLSWSWVRPDLDRARPRLGVRGQYRNLDRFSPAAASFPPQVGALLGTEWEISTYAMVGI